MEIKNYGSVMSAYVKSSYEPARRERSGVSAKNTDKAEFSSAAKDGGIAQAKAAVAKEIESFASPKRIAALKAMIDDGSYNISAESVAASIMEG
ncbi:MAG: flagellar biosynthesis anti-sigma factor FlgM [Ruminococcus sp.]|nr:flagellar biosynthesis anti-sigma factor FlgM [Ruminococcus sp.]MCM1380652.1 flagellar biosynthesis anti-sigma factor FlgM [Muribaculaceae bacterium]MCM1479484.1 flagellar biosynthesis anti-sigma factor FlgM [Muribaculaceae bacterium]